MVPGRLTADDFFTGLFAALAQRGGSTYSIRGEQFDKAIASLFNTVEELARQNDLELRFRVRLHPLHGDSATVRNSITNAARRDLISLDNPEYQIIRLKLSPGEAEDYLRVVPGGAAMYNRLADAFLAEYEKQSR